MANSYAKAKGRSERGRFVALPHRCLEHINFTRLTPKAVKLFIDLSLQYNGRNNGDLTTAFSVLRKRGWRSSETLYLAIDELLHYGWITRTRIGGLNRIPNLYALTFQAIDDCGGKLGVNSTITPPGNWKQLVDAWVKPANYQAIDKRRKAKAAEQNEKKPSLRKPYLIASESEAVKPIRGQL